MSTFFDHTGPDLPLLHSSVRDHEELDIVADKVEWEVIDHYTQRELPGYVDYSAFFEYEDGAGSQNELQVRLIGYDSDKPDQSDQRLKEALRRTIADVTSWILRNYDRSQGVDSIQQGNRSQSGEIPSWRDWPKGWDNKLTKFDARTGTYRI